MPKTEIVRNLLSGQEATVIGPGSLKFEAAAQALPKAATATKTAMGGGTVLVGKGAGLSQGMATAGGGATAKSVTASLMSGKVLGVSLGSLNPWVLLAIGGGVGYLYAKRKFPRLVW